MLDIPDPQSRFYRVTDDQLEWSEVLSGAGAFFNAGGRYNRTHQATLYAGLDPLVALSEAAFYQARHWQDLLSQTHVQPLTYPLRSEHLLWCFTLTPPPVVVDLSHPGARQRFPHPPHLLLNPSQHYEATRNLADQVRTYQPPAGSPDPKPEGLVAPSVRTARPRGYRPTQHVLFVVPPPVARPWSERAALVAQWRVAFEFQEPIPRQAVTFHSTTIDWAQPLFRLGGPATAVVPAFPARPGAKAYRPGRRYRLTVRFT